MTNTPRTRINNGGRSIERPGFPKRKVLEQEDAPAPVREAHATWRSAVDEANEARSTFQAAERAAHEAVPRLRGERERHDFEVGLRVRDEQEAQRRAETRATAAARALVDAVDEHADTLRALAARMALAAYLRQVDAYIDLLEAGRDKEVAPIVPRHPMVPDFDDLGGLAAGLVGGRTPQERLDLATNTYALAEIAGDRLGMVEAVSRAGHRLLTTQRRAAMLAKSGGHGRPAQDWSVVETEEDM